MVRPGCPPAAKERRSMGENQERRRARRQRRGLLRVDEILAAAGALFAEIGYDKATTNLIAARAGVSPGSLYQFFPNKEAIALAYATAATAELHQLYDTILAPEVTALPLLAFLDTFIDALMVFNRNYPGYLALSIASTISSSLALALADLQRGIFGRLEALFAALLPQSSPEERRLRGLISYRVFIAVLSLALDAEGDDARAIVRELKTVLYRYWAPIIGPERAPDEPPP
jgi:AcrR family transcriptional regulator